MPSSCDPGQGRPKELPNPIEPERFPQRACNKKGAPFGAPELEVKLPFELLYVAGFDRSVIEALVNRIENVGRIGVGEAGWQSCAAQIRIDERKHLANCLALSRAGHDVQVCKT